MSFITKYVEKLKGFFKKIPDAPLFKAIKNLISIPDLTALNTNSKPAGLDLSDPLNSKTQMQDAVQQNFEGSFNHSANPAGIVQQFGHPAEAQVDVLELSKIFDAQMSDVKNILSDKINDLARKVDQIESSAKKTGEPDEFINEKVEEMERSFEKFKIILTDLDNNSFNPFIDDVSGQTPQVSEVKPMGVPLESQSLAMPPPSQNIGTTSAEHASDAELKSLLDDIKKDTAFLKEESKDIVEKMDAVNAVTHDDVLKVSVKNPNILEDSLHFTRQALKGEMGEITLDVDDELHSESIDSFDKSTPKQNIVVEDSINGGVTNIQVNDHSTNQFEKDSTQIPVGSKMGNSDYLVHNDVSVSDDKITDEPLSGELKQSSKPLSALEKAMERKNKAHDNIVKKHKVTSSPESAVDVLNTSLRANSVAIEKPVEEQKPIVSVDENILDKSNNLLDKVKNRKSRFHDALLKKKSPSITTDANSTVGSRSSVIRKAMQRKNKMRDSLVNKKSTTSLDVSGNELASQSNSDNSVSNPSSLSSTVSSMLLSGSSDIHLDKPEVVLEEKHISPSNTVSNMLLSDQDGVHNEELKASDVLAVGPKIVVSEELRHETPREEAVFELTPEVKEHVDENPSQSSHSLLHVRASDDQSFKLSDGTILYSIDDLKNNITSMSDEVFFQHVNFTKNDFASWVRGVFKIDALADNLSQKKNKSSIKFTIEEYFKNH